MKYVYIRLLFIKILIRSKVKYEKKMAKSHGVETSERLKNRIRNIEDSFYTELKYDH